MTPNHRINADLLQRRFASLPQAGYAERWATRSAVGWVDEGYPSYINNLIPISLTSPSYCKMPPL